MKSLRGYLLAITTLSVAVLLLLALRDRLSTSTVALILLLPVLWGATVGGLGPGLATAFLAFLAYNYLFLLPYYTFVVHQAQDIIALVVFLIVALLISQLVGRARINLAAAIDREQELSLLYEMSMTLSGSSSLQHICEVIAQQTSNAIGQALVQVEAISIPGETGLSYHAPEDKPIPPEPPQMLVPMQTPRGQLGEIRVWSSSRPMLKNEERILRTLAMQGAVALERATLAQAESRARALEESDRLKSTLLSLVSHDLRTPLVSIKASTTSLLGGLVDWDSSTRQELLTMIDEETDHLNYLVGNLLDMSRMEAGAMQPKRQWNLLAEIIDGVVARNRRAMQQYRLSLDIPEDLPLIPLDYVQIEQVFTNLLTNSFKYSPKGSEIRIRAQVSEGYTLLVEVQNQSPHVPVENLELIFDKFHRFTNADNVSGIGLGLSICKGIIEAHGGQIWAENLPKGFAFKFTLPLSLDGTLPPKIQPESV